MAENATGPLGDWLGTPADPSGLAAFEDELGALLGTTRPMSTSRGNMIMDTIVFTDRQPDPKDIEFLTRWSHMAAEAIDVLREGVRRMEARMDEMQADDELTIEQVRWLKTGETP